MLGGLHTFLAKSQLAQEIPDNYMFKVVNAKVYVDLRDDESLRLAQRYNENSLNYPNYAPPRRQISLIYSNPNPMDTAYFRKPLKRLAWYLISP